MTTPTPTPDARCDVEFVNGRRSTKAAGHWTPQNGDVHTPHALDAGLRQRIETALRATPVSGHAHEPGQEEWEHHKGTNSPGHSYSICCALCVSDIAALVAALLPLVAAERAVALRKAADAIDRETQALKDAGVLEPDQYRPCRDAAVQLRAMAGCPACEAEIEHDAHCPTPGTHNWGCACGATTARAGAVHPDDQP